MVLPHRGQRRSAGGSQENASTARCHGSDTLACGAATAPGPPCAACGDLIPTGGLEIEVQFMTPNGFTARRFHTLCFAVWELERDPD
jgi:hypothetical protein